jgi:hypothetical protein
MISKTMLQKIITIGESVEAHQFYTVPDEKKLCSSGSCSYSIYVLFNRPKFIRCSRFKTSVISSFFPSFIELKTVILNLYFFSCIVFFCNFSVLHKEVRAGEDEAVGAASCCGSVYETVVKSIKKFHRYK